MLSDSEAASILLFTPAIKSKVMTKYSENIRNYEIYTREIAKFIMSIAREHDALYYAIMLGILVNSGTFSEPKPLTVFLVNLL